MRVRIGKKVGIISAICAAALASVAIPVAVVNNTGNTTDMELIDDNLFQSSTTQVQLDGAAGGIASAIAAGETLPAAQPVAAPVSGGRSEDSVAPQQVQTEEPNGDDEPPAREVSDTPAETESAGIVPASESEVRPAEAYVVSSETLPARSDAQVIEVPRQIVETYVTEEYEDVEVPDTVTVEVPVTQEETATVPAPDFYEEARTRADDEAFVNALRDAESKARQEAISQLEESTQVVDIREEDEVTGGDEFLIFE